MNWTKRIVSVLLAAALLLSLMLLAGCGSSTAVVPDVVGMSQQEAEAAVTDAGLVMKVSRERYSDDTPAGDIDRMDTAAGEELDKGETVKVVVSLGKGATVPDMGALTPAEAENLLTVLGFNCIVEEEYSDDVPQGSIISYTDGGRTLAFGSDVTLTVSRGPAD